MYLRLEGKQGYKRDAKANASQSEQYENTVHLFIGTGRSPCKIISSHFAFDNNSIVIYLGLDILFLFKSVFSFLPSCRSSLAHSFGSVPFFVFFLCFFIPWVLVRRSLSTHYTPETLLNHVFEDLRKPKAPNIIHAAIFLVDLSSTSMHLSVLSVDHFPVAFLPSRTSSSAHPYPKAEATTWWASSPRLSSPCLYPLHVRLSALVSYTRSDSSSSLSIEPALLHPSFQPTVHTTGLAYVRRESQPRAPFVAPLSAPCSCVSCVRVESQDFREREAPMHRPSGVRWNGNGW
jgi:hypothetical protein